MKWEDILNQERFRGHSVPQSQLDGRNEFENDYTRLIFSSPVRRLQDKAQVFPLDNSDFVRTRLTHSIEVSAIGRSIGASVEKELIKKGELDNSYQGKISSLLAAVGLAHDLGNPPFGHFGEYSIQNYFKNFFESKEYKDIISESASEALSKEELEDFKCFEGNAQCFRLLTKLQYLLDENGYNLSYGTLSAIQKYPRSSTDGNKDKNPNISYKKFGYFQAEKETFDRVVRETKTGSLRNPIAFLLEAADDIAYSAADIEDGFKKKVLNFNTLKDCLGKHLNMNVEADKDLFNSLDKYMEEVHPDYPEGEEIAVQRFRIKAQGYMIESVVKAFLDKYKSMMSGTFDKEILIESSAGSLRKALKELAYKHIFTHKEIITVELVADEVIRGLLSMFISAVISPESNNPKSTSYRLYQLISPNYRFICEQYPVKRNAKGKPSLYDKLLLVTDFVCGMTDSYAIELYRKLKGIKL